MQHGWIVSAISDARREMREADRLMLASQARCAEDKWFHPDNAKYAEEHYRMAEARYQAALDDLEWYRAWLTKMPAAMLARLFALLEREAPEIKRALLEVLESPTPRK